MKLEPEQIVYGNTIPDISPELIAKNIADVLLDKSLNESDLAIRLKCNICCCRKKEQNDLKLYGSWNFNEFEKFIDNNIKWIIENLDIRWKVSILECYMNNGTESQNIVAFSSSMLVHINRILHSLPKTYNILDKWKTKTINNDYDGPVNFYIRIKPHLTGSVGLLFKSIFREYEKNNYFIYNRFSHNNKLSYNIIHDIINDSDDVFDLFQKRHNFLK